MAKNNYAKKSEKDFDSAKNLLRWNKFLFLSIGMWPKMNKKIFLSFYYYFTYHVLKDFVALFFTFSGHNLLKVIGTGLECISLTQLYVRFCMLKNHNKYFITLLKQFEQDYSIENYKTEKERKVFIYYSSTAKKFVSIVFSFFTITAGLYFIQPLIRQLSMFEEYFSYFYFVDIITCINYS